MYYSPMQDKRRNMEKYFYVKNQRLAKYLYSVGFDKTSEYKDNQEIWKFEKSDALQEALDFYSYIRNKTKKSGDDSYENTRIQRLP